LWARVIGACLRARVAFFGAFAVFVVFFGGMRHYRELNVTSPVGHMLCALS